MSKVFLSYSHKDQNFVEELYRRLTRDGVNCFFDKESIIWGANWVDELEKGIDNCEFVMLTLSPDFCQSEWSKLERTGAMADDRGAEPIPAISCSRILYMPIFMSVFD
jgi:hypothetical protein